MQLTSANDDLVLPARSVKSSQRCCASARLGLGLGALVAACVVALVALLSLAYFRSRPARRPDFDWAAWGQEFETTLFEQQADHMNAYHQQTVFLNWPTTTFNQRLWINTKAWRGAAARAPIFVIILPYGGFKPRDFGFVGEMARDMGALVVQVEGRFTPESLPFNESSFDKQPNRVGLMSGENAVRDYATLISFLRDKYDPEWACPTGTFGISLGGFYSAWMRFKFPNIVDFAVASGAPLLAQPGIGDPLALNRRLTEIWLEISGDSRCIDLVRQSFEALMGHECRDSLMASVYMNAAVFSYPPQGLIESSCAAGLAKKSEGASATDVALALCGPACNGGSCPAGTGSIFQSRMWDYVSCTQQVNPVGNDGVSDFILPADPWNTSKRADECLQRWGVEPQKEGNYNADLFGWHRLPQLADGVSRILFAYGTYDPWAVFAPSTTDISKELPVVMARGGVHGTDLAGTTSVDTSDMLAAREKEAAHVARWVRAVQARRV